MKHHDDTHRSQWKNRTFLIIGLGSLVWLLLRSGPSPRRLAYPCQRAALASSVGLLGYLAALLGSISLYRRFRRRGTLANFSFWMVALLLTAILPSSSTRTTLVNATLTLPTWTGSTAISNVYVVQNVPIPECSLNGGTLPSTAPCNAPSYSLRDAGVESIINEMELRGDYFYETAGHPSGVVGADDVVVIKINNQWGLNGQGNGVGRLSTNTDVLKGLIWAILQHPSGFTGEVVVVENTQDSGATWTTTPANSQDRNQSYQDVVNAFAGLGYPVSLSDWSVLNYSLISGGSANGSGYPSGEYATGNTSDCYILLEDSAGTGTNELSYPKFQTAGGNYVSMRYGIWNGSSYDANHLTFINVPVLKAHGMAGATIAWKNLIGFITTFNNESRYGDWDEMHDYFFGYTGGANQNYGLVGRQMALIRTPDLNLVDAIWVADDNYDGNATRQNVLLASTDPFAVDWYASEYVLRPVMLDSTADVSAARDGIFRSASRINQNAAATNWSGGYPYIDLLDSYSGSTPSSEEQNQMNVYLCSAGIKPKKVPLPAIMYLLE